MGDAPEPAPSGTANASGPGSIAVGAVGRDVHIGSAPGVPVPPHASGAPVAAGVVLGDLIVHQAVPGPAAVVTRVSPDPSGLFVGRGEQSHRALPAAGLPLGGDGLVQPGFHTGLQRVGRRGEAGVGVSRGTVP